MEHKHHVEQQGPEPWYRLGILEQKKLLEERTGMECPWTDDELLGLQDHGYMLAETGLHLAEASRDWLAAERRRGTLSEGTTTKVLNGRVYTADLQSSEHAPAVSGVLFEAVGNPHSDRASPVNADRLPTIQDLTTRIRADAIGLSLARKFVPQTEPSKADSTGNVNVAMDSREPQKPWYTTDFPQTNDPRWILLLPQQREQPGGTVDDAESTSDGK